MNRDNPDSYFTGIPNAVIDRVASLSPPSSVWAVLLHLHRRANKDGSSWWSQSKMADECGLSRDTVLRMVSWLEDHYLLRVERSKGDGSTYHLLPVGISDRVVAKSDNHLSEIPTPLYIRTEEDPIEKEPVKRSRACARKSEGCPESLDEVLAFAQEEGIPRSEAESFWLHFETNGWKVGRAATPMKKWRMGLQAWHRRQAEFAPQRNGKPKHEDPIEHAQRLGALNP